MTNRYKVQKKQWTKWSVYARAIFNSSYKFFLSNQDLMRHPEAPRLPAKLWKTIAWNAAWIAAASCDDCIPTKFIEAGAVRRVKQ